LASYARQWERFEEARLQVVGIVVDPVENNAGMVDKLLLPFPILSDPEGRVIKAYGVWSDGEGGIAKPSLFLVPPDRSVLFSYVGEDFADRPSDDELFGAVASMRKRD
jgi:peroxiredoxin